MNKLSQCLLILIIAVTLGACNASDSGFTGTSGGGTSGGAGSGTSPTTPGDSTGNGGSDGSGGSTGVSFGSGTGSSFKEGELGVGFGVAKLSTGASTEIRTTLVYNDLTPYTGSGTVVFSSVCAQAGLATITAKADIASGAAVASYVNTGCNQLDTITATTSVGGQNMRAQGQIKDVAPVRFGSGSSTSFRDGVLKLASPEILTGQTTTVTASLLNKDGSAFSGDAQVTFVSDCANATIDSPVKVEKGAAVAKFAPGTCVGDDIIVATYAAGGETKIATAKLTIAPSVKIGSGSGTGFKQGVLETGVGNATLSAGGTTLVEATLVNAADNSLYTGVGSVTFASVCAANGHATVVSPVSVVNGVAESSYTAGNGCEGSDTITATYTLDSNSLTATSSVNIASPAIGSIIFKSATPQVISFAGSELNDIATVTFQVLDDKGNPKPNQTVDFGLSTEVGGLNLTADSAISDSDGMVTATLQAGTIHTPVRVTATVADTTPAIQTQSSQLVISTGIPDADSFSISAESLNPGGYNYDGIVDTITVHLADRFNNPVPDGTAVTFTAEGGSIDGSCVTTNGACSVTWTSSNPRPADGRATIFAYAIGEESFIDIDGDGKFGTKDVYPISAGPALAGKPTFMDLPEPFEDSNESGGDFEPGTDLFFDDFNKNGSWDKKDQKYEGLQCQTLCGPTKTAAIGQQIVLIMSGAHASITTDPANCLATDSTAPMTQTSIPLYIRDKNCQVMPAGTTISLKTQSGTVKIDSPTSYTVESSNARPPIPPYDVQVEKADAASVIAVTVTAPNGDKTLGKISFF